MNKDILYQGKKIFYRIYGSGKPVMLVHGFGEDGTVWQNQAPSDSPPTDGGEQASTLSQLNEIAVVNKKIRFIIPDLPGSGQSELIHDMSMEGMAEVLHTIIHEEDIDRCTMIGHSMGGYITLAFAEKYFNHLKAFGLIHSTALADSEEKKEIRKKGNVFINQYGAFEFLKTTIPNLFSANSKSKIKNSIASFIESLSNFSPAALITYYEAMMSRPDRTSVLKSSNIPVLFVAGEHDNAVPLADSLKQSYMPDICHFHILKNSGHMGMMEEPEKLNMILGKFLS